jgi:hypothetical protein
LNRNVWIYAANRCAQGISQARRVESCPYLEIRRRNGIDRLQERHIKPWAHIAPQTHSYIPHDTHNRRAGPVPGVSGDLLADRISSCEEMLGEFLVDYCNARSASAVVGCKLAPEQQRNPNVRKIPRPNLIKIGNGIARRSGKIAANGHPRDPIRTAPSASLIAILCRLDAAARQVHIGLDLRMRAVALRRPRPTSDIIAATVNA